MFVQWDFVERWFTKSLKENSFKYPFITFNRMIFDSYDEYLNVCLKKDFLFWHKTKSCYQEIGIKFIIMW